VEKTGNNLVTHAGSASLDFYTYNQKKSSKKFLELSGKNYN
jgi:hypothetical protein